MENEKESAKTKRGMLMEGFQFFLQMIPPALLIFSPVLIAATGGMICERSGVTNIALEGLMVFGAMTAAVTHVLLESASSFSIPVSLIFAALCGGLFSLIHAFASVTLKADQIISGTGINLLSNGMTVFICQVMFRMDRTPNYRTGMSGGFFGIYPAVWLALVIFAGAWFVLYKRPCGLRLCAAGVNPQSLECTPVSVARIRYIAVLISGLLAGLAGGCIILTQNIQFSASAINGKGFIALAAVSFGRRFPPGIFGFCLLFGFVSSFAVNIVSSKGLPFLPPEFFYMLPFLITLFTLVIFSGNIRKNSAQEH
jgi:simple sugar transport system permease protein